MKEIRFRLLIAFLAVLMGSVIAKAQTAEDTPPPPAMHGHHMAMGMGHEGEMQLRQYVEGNFDEAKVGALAAQKAQVQAQLTIEQTRIHNQLYQLLTDDQKSQLKQMEANHETRMQQRMNKQAPAAPQQ